MRSMVEGASTSPAGVCYRTVEPSHEQRRVPSPPPPPAAGPPPPRAGGGFSAPPLPRCAGEEFRARHTRPMAAKILLRRKATGEGDHAKHGGGGDPTHRSPPSTA